MLAPRYKILTSFLNEPSKEKYGREIEMDVDVSHERVVHYLGELVGEKILYSQKRGRQVFYGINTENEAVRRILSSLEFERKKRFLSENKEIAVLLHELREDILRTQKGEVQFILLFGSVARGGARGESDIDLLVVSTWEGTPEEIVGEVRKRSKISGRGISTHFISLDELRKSWHEEPIYKNIWRERMVLYGEDRFWEFVLEEGEAF